MKNINIKKISIKNLAVLLIPFILSGCGKKSECTNTTNHVHKYTLNCKYGNVTTYIDSEYMEYNGFDWNEEYIEITSDDKEFYKVKDSLFDGLENWECVYNFMSTRKDFLAFYYSYDTKEDYWDGEGDYHPKTVNHSGWSHNPTHQGVTGDVRLYHYRFFGYKILYENGKYIKYKSPLVDDIRTVIFDFPYLGTDFTDLVYNSYKYNISDLPNIKLSDFDGVFKGPDDSSELYNKRK